MEASLALLWKHGRSVLSHPSIIIGDSFRLHGFHFHRLPDNACNKGMIILVWALH